MNEKIKGVAAAMAAVAALAVGGAAIAGASGDGGEKGDSQRPISASALDQASAAALDHTGGGTVSETEVGDEESYYEVEVTLDDGSQVDVQLDRGFAVVGQSADSQNDE